MNFIYSNTALIEDFPDVIALSDEWQRHQVGVQITKISHCCAANVGEVVRMSLSYKQNKSHGQGGRCFRQKADSDPGASGLAILNVGDTCMAVRRGAGYSLRILNQLSKQDAIHAGIFDTSEDEMIVAEILAESVGECCGVGGWGGQNSACVR